MRAFHLPWTDRIAELFESIVVHRILEPGQIADKLTKTVVGLGRVLDLKLFEDLSSMAFADSVQFCMDPLTLLLFIVCN